MLRLYPSLALVRPNRLANFRQPSTFEVPYASIAARFLQRVFSPAVFVSTALLINANAPVRFSVPKAQETLEQRMRDIFHRDFCATHDPKAHIPKAMLPFLRDLALLEEKQMRDEERRLPTKPDVPVLPSNSPLPGPVPLSPCCQGEGLLAATLPKRNRGMKISKDQQSTPT